MQLNLKTVQYILYDAYVTLWLEI